MWYFAWILGVLLACSFGIINALWLENTENMDRETENKD
ncbi:cytochrome bd-I oxidase subunit CydX [Shewanella benthica]|nr:MULTISPECIES: cytochrome bd-I oxidase subunit CydX [Shewanella]MBE7213833.1 cytochrome bd-I oxidase subunit CydX [Shewanella benthica]MBL4817129.1 cytochrome bd-I oxidase subunit CydX [Shewanella sp.]MCJ8302339.1 cytochrome bd-I oxidase subunit CydX [Shewanella sp.]MCL1061739.1 cytochrome bd-I oxidase subunit CydX [Shewanella benthica]